MLANEWESVRLLSALAQVQWRWGCLLQIVPFVYFCLIPSLAFNFRWYRVAVNIGNVKLINFFEMRPSSQNYVELPFIYEQVRLTYPHCFGPFMLYILCFISFNKIGTKYIGLAEMWKFIKSKGSWMHLFTQQNILCCRYLLLQPISNRLLSDFSYLVSPHDDDTF